MCWYGQGMSRLDLILHGCISLKMFVGSVICESMTNHSPKMLTYKSTITSTASNKRCHFTELAKRQFKNDSFQMYDNRT